MVAPRLNLLDDVASPLLASLDDQQSTLAQRPGLDSAQLLSTFGNIYQILAMGLYRDLLEDRTRA